MRACAAARRTFRAVSSELTAEGKLQAFDLVVVFLLQRKA
jgi:hypothetical protein